MYKYIKSSDTCPDFKKLYDLSSIQDTLVDDTVYWSDYVNPIKTPLGRKLKSKSINTLSVEDIAILYTMAWVDYMWSMYDGDFIGQLEYCWDSHSDDFYSCYYWLHSLSFPLQIYRAVTEKELSAGIDGRSWTTDINLYTAKNSIFKNCDSIYTATINANAISNADTIMNYVHYTSRPQYGFYPESEITLKKNFHPTGITQIDKSQL